MLLLISTSAAGSRKAGSRDVCAQYKASYRTGSAQRSVKDIYKDTGHVFKLAMNAFVNILNHQTVAFFLQIFQF